MSINKLNRPAQAIKVANIFCEDLNKELDKLDVKDDCEIDHQFWEAMSNKIEEIINLSFREGRNLAISVTGDILANIDFDDPSWSIDDIITELEKKTS